MTSKLLLQEEIDALLGNLNREKDQENYKLLRDEDMEAMSEILNKSMSQVAATMSMLLSTDVNVIHFSSNFTDKKLLSEKLNSPYAFVKADFTDDFEGSTFYFIKVEDALTIARMLIGELNDSGAKELTEIEVSAASEMFNQVAGSAASAMSQLLNRVIGLAAQPLTILRDVNELSSLPISDSFLFFTYRLAIGDLMVTEIFQIVCQDSARTLASYLVKEPQNEKTVSYVSPKDGAEAYTFTPGVRPNSFDIPVDRNKMNLILDIPLKVTVILGRTRRPIKEVLGLTPGALIELASLADDPVEVLVNGTLVARGEIVVVNENFGVRITSIISPAERVQSIGK